MTELTPEAKGLLAQLRNLDDPTAEQRASGDAAVRDMLQAHGLVGLPPLAGHRLNRVGANAASTRQPLAANRTNDLPALAAPSGAGAKLAWTALGALVVAFGLYAAQPQRAPVLAPQPPAQALSAQTAPSPAPSEPLARDAAPEHADNAHTSAAGSGGIHMRRAATKAAPSSLSEELKFLASVDAELRGGAYDHALQRLAQHKGSPALSEERAALHVLALCGRDGDAAAARARDQFLKRAPSSLLAVRVRGACRAEPRP